MGVSSGAVSERLPCVRGGFIHQQFSGLARFCPWAETRVQVVQLVASMRTESLSNVAAGVRGDGPLTKHFGSRIEVVEVDAPIPK
jgi:hypothetical protein